MAIDDRRRALTWRHHRKRKRLLRKLGAEAVLAIEDLWDVVASTPEMRPDGVLRGLDAEDVAAEVDYPGDASELLSVLRELRLVDVLESGEFKIHDWEDHQPFIAQYEDYRGRMSELGKRSAERRAKRTDDGTSTTRSTTRSTNSSTGRSTPDQTRPDQPYQTREEEVRPTSAEASWPDHLGSVPELLGRLKIPIHRGTGGNLYDPDWWEGIYQGWKSDPNIDPVTELPKWWTWTQANAPNRKNLKAAFTRWLNKAANMPRRR